jgi:hypothetical protein
VIRAALCRNEFRPLAGVTPKGKLVDPLDLLPAL